ncbi:MAG: hypothetical protein FWD60_04680 [Candidatus Azobacteroides sp.]|nr:hypothetical protein [Candidatus Azobacteroides sp.]
MIKVDSIIKENSRKKEILNKPYDQMTGLGCYGKRACLKINDAPFPLLYLPEEMMKEDVCVRLKRYKSIRRLFEVGKEEYTQESEFLFWISFCSLRAKYDFEYYCVAYVVIRDKTTAVDIPFKLNRPQREKLLPVLEDMRINGLPIRFNYLKSRQIGGSTLIQIYMNWIQMFHRKNWNSVVCAHIKDAAIRIRAMYERAIENMLPIDENKYTIKNYKNTQNIKQVPERGCLITIGTALEPDSVRSDDVKMAHLSEMAYYPDTENNNPQLTEATITSSIPEEPYTLIGRETTANGIGDYFYEQWEKAKAGKTVFENIFVPWYFPEIYSREFDGCYYLHNGKRKKGNIVDFVKSMNEYEINTFTNHPDCTLENLNWRRLKAGTMPNERFMKQEFPLDDIEAFQDSGMPAFRSEDIEALRKDCRNPVSVGILASDCPPELAKTETLRRNEILSNLHFVEDRDALADILSDDTKVIELKEREKLKVWEFPDTEIQVSDRYVVVFDPQKGISEAADWGVMTVFDRFPMVYGGVPEVIAEWKGRIDKDIAIWIAVQVAKYYNDALLVIESNTYDSDIKEDDSEFVFDTISYYYNNLYSRTPADKIKEGIPVKYGFNTNRSTKPMIIGNYVAILREKGYKERSNEALNEAHVYEKKKNGSFGAKIGKHDDILITRMIGCYICYDLPTPVVLDDIQKYKPERAVGESSI